MTGGERAGTRSPNGCSSWSRKRLSPRHWHGEGSSKGLRPCRLPDPYTRRALPIQQWRRQVRLPTPHPQHLASRNVKSAPAHLPSCQRAEQRFVHASHSLRPKRPRRGESQKRRTESLKSHLPLVRGIGSGTIDSGSADGGIPTACIETRGADSRQWCPVADEKGEAGQKMPPRHPIYARQEVRPPESNIMRTNGGERGFQR